MLKSTQYHYLAGNSFDIFLAPHSFLLGSFHLEFYYLYFVSVLAFMTSYTEYLTDTISVSIATCLMLKSNKTSFNGTILAQFVMKPVMIHFLFAHPVNFNEHDIHKDVKNTTTIVLGQPVLTRPQLTTR